MKRLEQFTFILLILAAGSAAADKPLSWGASIKAHPTAIAAALAVAGVRNMDSHQLSSMMTSIYQQHDRIEGFATKAGCAEFASADMLNRMARDGGSLNPRTCYCTDDDQIFDRWLAPVFERTTGYATSILFTERRLNLAGNEFRVVADRDGIVKGGWLSRGQANKLKFRVWVNGTERGQKAAQQFCNFNGQFKLFTTSIEGQFIGIDIKKFAALAATGQPLDIARAVVRDGYVSYLD